VGPSVVTIVEDAPERILRFGPFSDIEDPEPRNIGTGFIVSQDGLIVTNKHVVSDTDAKYQIITNDDRRYDIENIYRDPLNDVAIIKVNPSGNIGASLKPVELGNSSGLQVGQFAIAIGTALGEFRNTVTTGVISGLGRGVNAGSEFEGFAERLDDVIQTSAAINPGNSGGPLVNSSGQVIGVNTAVAREGQNIGFALPINLVKEALNNFNQFGEIRRPYLGVVYTLITKDISAANDLPEGAFIERVVDGSGAEEAGLEPEDIVTEADGKKISEGESELGNIITGKKVGDRLALKVIRNDTTMEVSAILKQAPNQ
jgi:serine protease Do